MSKIKNKNLSAAIKSLRDCIDRIEGQYSNIPECCIEGYLEGRTFSNVYNCLDDKGKKKLEKWEYVPCEKCFKKNKRNKLKEGTSEIGFILYSIMDLLEERRNNESN